LSAESLESQTLDSRRRTMKEDRGLWIDNEEVAAEGVTRIPVFNPYTLAQWGTISEASSADVERAVHSADHAFRNTWAQVNGYQRGRLMNRLADLLDARAEYFAELETRNNGKLYKETLTQVRFAARSYRYFAGYADKIHGQYLPLDNGQIVDFTRYKPFGVVALITPWNSPMAILSNKLAPALAAGNCAVVKPSEFASITTIEFASLIMEAGFPAGVVNVVTGAGSTGASLVGHDRVRKVSFTGGNVGGRMVMEQAAKRQVPVTLELGGKSPNIVFSDANVSRAINGAIAGIFAAGGQTCIAGSRLLVQRPVYAQVVEELADRARQIRQGDPMQPDTQMGPVANGQQHERILGVIARAREGGARMVAGPGIVSQRVPERGLFVPATIFADVKNDMDIARQEVFGPVLAVLPFDDEDEAISIANDSAFGLAGGIWTEHVARAHRVAARLECGNVWVNTYRMGAVQAPFGGVKGSGFGRERGSEGLHAYLTVQNVMVNTSDTDDDPFSIRT
jgi:acyl-CoA reductase-like NAD-dependent aldehyde dehydrogenase